MAKIEHQAIEEQGKTFRRIVYVLLAVVGLFVVFLLLPVQPALWLFVAIGLIPGILYSARRFHQWAEFSAWESKENAKRWTVVYNLLWFFILFAVNFGLSMIRYDFSKDLADGIAGALIGGFTGFLLWPLWLYSRRAKSTTQG